MPALFASRRRVPLLAAGLAAAIVATLAAAPAAMGAPDTGKVTICHRTHSVTNPYRMITVSLNAADGQGNNDHTGHDDVYDDNGTPRPVFDPEVDYPANAKLWGDIIPPVRNSPGLNWTTRGQDIYNGAGSSFGLCGRMSAKQFFDVEVAAGVRPVEVLEDLDDQNSREDAELLRQLGVASFSQLDPANLPSAFQLAPAAPKGAPLPNGFRAEQGKQKVAVLVWFDLDRDGAYDVDELPAPGISVDLSALVEVNSSGFAPASTIRMSAGELRTDANGLAIVDSIPAGQWDVSAQAPQGTEVTYDSEGEFTDGRALVDVPADSAGFAWVGLIPAAADGGAGGGTDGGADGGTGGEVESGVDGSTTPEFTALPETGGPLDAASLAVGAGALVMLGIAFARRASSARRRSEALLEGE